MVERRLPNILMLETKACTFVIIFQHYDDVDVLDAGHQCFHHGNGDDRDLEPWVILMMPFYKIG